MLRGRGFMYLMYVDESGDIGLNNSPTDIFVLSGVVMHELRWRDYLDQLIDFRKRMLKKYNLHMRDEIHASYFINRPGTLVRINRHDRLSILRLFAEELANMIDLNVINIVVNKKNKPIDYDVFERGWQALIQRFENTISYKNFKGPSNPDERGFIISDNTDGKKLTNLVRRMRRYNPIPNQNRIGYRNLVLRNTIEDPSLRNSAESYFIQAADLTAYLLFQNKFPNKYMKKTAGDKYFYRLDPILCKVASQINRYGVVEL